MKTISHTCPKCETETMVEFHPGEIHCSSCDAVWGTLTADADPFDRCFLCGCRQFFTTKDFNQVLGCAVMLIAILFVPATYGLSLPTAALIDWLLYRRVPGMIVCYKCRAEYRGFETTRSFKPFMHHIGLKYDKYH